MIDRTARNRLAELLRHVGSGVIGIERFRQRGRVLSRSSSDEAVRVVFGAAFDLLLDFLDDRGISWNSTIRLRGMWKLCQGERRAIARSIVFLHSSCDYQSPPSYPRELDLTPGAPGCVFAILGPALMAADLLLMYHSQSSGIFVAMLMALIVYLVSLETAYRRTTAGYPFHVWPFHSMHDYMAACQQPRLLAGSRL